ncbi:MAG: ATP-binding protein [Erysipelotrichaceae bacterium]
MKKRLILLVSIVTTSIIIISFLSSYLLFYQHRYQNFVDGLMTHSQIIEDFIQSDEFDKYEDFELSQNRITIIASDGSVIYDNQMDNLENHADREEIIDALANGYGVSSRFSESLNTKMVYYATLLEDGSVLRVSNKLDYVFISSFDFIFVSILLILVTIITSIWLVNRLISKIVEPLSQIDLDYPENNQNYPELIPLFNKIESHNQMRKEFSANVSHELKTPLQSIMGYSELIVNDMVMEEDVKQFNLRINQEAHRLLDMIEDIIHLARLDENKIHSEFNLVNYRSLVEDCISKYASFAKKKNVTVVANLKDVEGLGIEPILKETLNNLISNAIKYNKAQGKVWITLSENREFIFIIIRDNGIGISEQDLPRVYERFFRADRSHNNTIEGSGLGLAIVKHSISLHNGQINVQSKLNSGTTFTIKLPKTY